MKNSRILLERVRRTQILCKELAYIIDDEELDELSFAATIHNQDGDEFAISIEADSKFLEFAFTFLFPAGFHDFIRDRMEEFLQICYQYGCYTAIIAHEDEIAVSVFSKLYFAGLQYYALKETLRDLRHAVKEIEELYDVNNVLKGGDNDGPAEPNGRQSDPSR